MGSMQSAILHAGSINIILKRIILDGKLDKIQQASGFLGGSIASLAVHSAVGSIVFHALGTTTGMNSGTKAATGFTDHVKSVVGILPTVTGYAERMERLTRLMELFGDTVIRDIGRIRTVATNLESADKT